MSSKIIENCSRLSFQLSQLDNHRDSLDAKSLSKVQHIYRECVQMRMDLPLNLRDEIFMTDFKVVESQGDCIDWVIAGLQQIFKMCAAMVNSRQDSFKTVTLDSHLRDLQNAAYLLHYRALHQKLKAKSDNRINIHNLNDHDVNQLQIVANRFYTKDSLEAMNTSFSHLSGNIISTLNKNLQTILQESGELVVEGFFSSAVIDGADKYKALLLSCCDSLALQIASAVGDDVSICHLLCKGRGISPDDLGCSLKNAAKNNHRGIAQILLSQRQQINPDYFFIALLQASKRGFLDMTRLLLSKERGVSQHHLGSVLISVSQIGNLDVAKILLSEDREVSTEHFSKALQSSSENNHLEVVNFLLSKGQNITRDDLGYAVLFAAEKGHLEVLEALLAPQSGRRITIEMRGNAVLAASISGHFSCVQFLLQNGPISASIRDSSITRVNGESRHIIRDVLRMATIDVDSTVRMRISFKEIKKDPIAVLQKLVENPLPHKFTLKERPNTVDLGGVSKEVYYTIFASLIEKEALFLTSENLPFIEEEKSQEIYKILGLFYSRLVQRNEERSDPYLTGCVFSEDFFLLVKTAFEHPDDVDSCFMSILSERRSAYRACFTYLMDKNDLKRAAVKEIMNTLGARGGATDFAKSILEAYKRPVLAFLEGVKSSGKTEGMIRSLNANELSDAFQGKKLSNELVLQSLRFKRGDSCFQQKCDWLKEKIINSDDSWLESFVFAVTGRRSLAPAATIIIQPTWRKRPVFEFHTCFNSLDLPKNPMSKDDFILGLKASLSSTRYNIA